MHFLHTKTSKSNRSSGFPLVWEQLFFTWFLASSQEQTKWQHFWMLDTLAYLVTLRQILTTTKTLLSLLWFCQMSCWAGCGIPCMQTVLKQMSWKFTFTSQLILVHFTRPNTYSRRKGPHALKSGTEFSTFPCWEEIYTGQLIPVIAISVWCVSKEEGSQP